MYLMKNVIRKTVASATVFNILIYYISQGIRLILIYKRFFIFHRITDQFFCVQIFPVHVHCRNLMILVSGVIINSPGSIHAGGINRDFIFSVRHPRIWKNCPTLSSSPFPDTACILVYATRTNRDMDDRSPGIPNAPIPLL